MSCVPLIPQPKTFIKAFFFLSSALRWGMIGDRGPWTPIIWAKPQAPRAPKPRFGPAIFFEAPMGNYKHAHLRGSATIRPVFIATLVNVAATFTRVAMNTGRQDVNKAHYLNQWHWHVTDSYWQQFSLNSSRNSNGKLKSATSYIPQVSDNLFCHILGLVIVPKSRLYKCKLP